MQSVTESHFHLSFVYGSPADEYRNHVVYCSIKISNRPASGSRFVILKAIIGITATCMSHAALFLSNDIFCSSVFTQAIVSLLCLGLTSKLLFTLSFLHLGQASANYEGLDFQTRALQRSNIHLTWEDDEPQRTKSLKRKFNGDQVGVFFSLFECLFFIPNFCTFSALISGRG